MRGKAGREVRQELVERERGMKFKLLTGIQGQTASQSEIPS